MRTGQRQTGVALITVMLIVTIATLVAVTIADRQNLDIHRSGNLLFSDQALQYDLGAEAWAIGLLERDAANGKSDNLGEEWATALPPIKVEGGTISARLIDLNGRMNPNNLVAADGLKVDPVGQSRFMRLFGLLKLPPEIIPALIDWTDSDLQPTGATGAEDDYYAALEVPYRAANAPIASLGELRQVRGVTDEIFQALAPHLAALPPGSLINVNTADHEVLVALGLDEGRAQAIIQARTDQPFESLEDFLGSPTLEGAKIKNARLGVTSRYFLLRAEAVIGEIHFRLNTTLYRDDKGVVSVVARSQGVG